MLLIYFSIWRADFYCTNMHSKVDEVTFTILYTVQFELHTFTFIEIITRGIKAKQLQCV